MTPITNNKPELSTTQVNSINLQSILLKMARRTQLIFTIFLLIFTLFIILQNSPLLSSKYSIISTIAPTVTPHLLTTSNTTFTSLSSIPHIVPKFVENGSASIVEKGPSLANVAAPAPKKAPRSQKKKESHHHVVKKNSSCDIFDGKWVLGNSDSIYSPGSCPNLDYAFNCFNNGRSEIGYLRYRWQPHGCDIPRLDGKKMLEMLRGKRMVFVGDSLNRNMWQSLICSLRVSLKNKKKLSSVISDKRHYAVKFKDYNCSIEYIRAPFLVQQWRIPARIKGVETRRETLRLDVIESWTSKYHKADFLIFNTGHWWTYHKTQNGLDFFQEGDIVHSKLRVADAYRKALNTWAKWIDKNVNKKKTKVFFSGYSASHFRGGQWNSGGNCDGETEPITNDNYLAPYPLMMKTLESVISKMKTPVVYLNITKMTGYRKDAHPSIYRQPGTLRQPGMAQDCSHWCLPGVPDTWNQLLYALLLQSSQRV